MERVVELLPHRKLLHLVLTEVTVDVMEDSGPVATRPLTVSVGLQPDPVVCRRLVCFQNEVVPLTFKKYR